MIHVLGIVLRMALSLCGFVAALVLAWRAETLAESTCIVVVGVYVCEQVLYAPRRLGGEASDGE